MNLNNFTSFCSENLFFYCFSENIASIGQSCVYVATGSRIKDYKQYLSYPQQILPQTTPGGTTCSHNS